ncbi:hypothetical protein [Haliangium sp. UPWRP_2]|uniref:hypothetical protein n=1 Tax=Haliangium sp. UPWRP_2 TaxID=1931276 RepID=UPI0011B25732|nr:hypothetical protein [Haliangium sp. UPWRP_2]
MDPILERVVTVTEGSGQSAIADKHSDPSHPPKISGVVAGVTIDFDIDTPNQGYKPIDKVIKLKVDIPAGPGINAGQQLCVITFGSQYVDKSGDPLPPMALVQDEGGANVPVWMISNLTSSSFPLITLFGLNPSSVARLRILIIPSN